MKIVFLFFVAVSLFTGRIYSGNIPGKSYRTLPVNVPAVVHDSVALENDYVKVMYNSSVISQGKSPEFGKRVIVALDEVKIRSGSGLKELKRGEVAVFGEEESYRIESGSFFEVAMKKDHPPYKGPDEWVEPVNNKVVYNDMQFRIFEERLGPGETRPLHSHAQRVNVRLNPARLTDPRINQDKNKEGSLQVPNTVKFAEPIVHAVKNVSKVPLFNIIIEFKYKDL